MLRTSTCPHLEFTFWTFAKPHPASVSRLFHLEGCANGDVFGGLSFLKRKNPI